MKIGGRPVFWLYALQNLIDTLGVGRVKKFVEKVREIASAQGYDIYLVGDIMSPAP